MYQPVLNRFLSRDPLPPDGQPDILYDNNWFGQRMTWMRNTYGYCDNNPVNKIDPSGLIAFDNTDCGNAKPKSDTSGCSIHHGGYYSGYDAECVCACAGSTGWDNFNRGCLECAERAGVPREEAHAACYKIADDRYGRLIGYLQRIDIAIRCQGCAVLYPGGTPLGLQCPPTLL